ncbi:MAG: MFS transporter [Pseudomonadota bacterium]
MNRLRSGWLQFSLVSAFFFQVTAATFTSLGVVLPLMIDEFEWTWSDAGLGFSILALLVGIASRVPALTLQRFGARTTFIAGGLLMAAGHALIATTAHLYQYYAGTAALGFGYTLCALIPGVAVINRCLPNQRSFAIGAYMMIGGLGGVAGPMIVTSVVAAGASWRAHWWLLVASISALVILAIWVLDGATHRDDEANDEDVPAENRSPNVFVTSVQWAYRDIVKTPQFVIIVMAQSLTLLTGLTTNTWAASHMGNLGIGAAIAAGALSAHALVNASSRVLGGWLATRIDPKWLLCAALAMESVGMLALSVADSVPMIGLFAIGEGVGFGMCMYASTMLLINYFGSRDSAKAMGTMYFIGTIGMVGPYLSGRYADWVGGFGDVFQFYAIATAITMVVVFGMRPPAPLAQDT